VLDIGEVCDDGEKDDCTGTCNAGCSGPANFCGDGVARCGEACDGAPGCRSDCTLDTGACFSTGCGNGSCDPADGESYLDCPSDCDRYGVPASGKANGDWMGGLTGAVIDGTPSYCDVYATGDHIVTTAAEFTSAAAIAVSGEVIFIPEGSSIDLTNRQLSIPSGVTLASNRGYHGSAGGKIYNDDQTDKCDGCTNWPPTLIMGEGCRVTGLQLVGPEPDYQVTDYNSLRTWAGVQCANDNCEVDNCEVSRWPNAITMSSGTTGGHVHHCYIHHNQIDPQDGRMLLSITNLTIKKGEPGCLKPGQVGHTGHV